MQDTAETIEPAGQADDTTEAPQPAGQADAATDGDDAQAQLMLADAMTSQQDDTAGQNGEAGGKKKDPWDDPESARRMIEQLRRESAGWRTKYRQAEPLASKYRQAEDSQKTEIQRATERAQSLEQELADVRTSNARMMALVNHNLPPDLIDLLGNGTEEEIDARAKLLADKLAAAAPQPEPAAAEHARPAPRRPVESLTPGARPAGERPADPNEAFRGFLNNARRA